MRRATRLGVLLPLLAALFPLADLTLRVLLPPEALCFRAWEAVTLRQRWPMPFEPDRRFRTAHAFGDLANIGNRRSLRVYRSETFTTDALGCRNDPALAREGKIDALFLGSSYTAGSGLDDAQTIPAQLAALAGQKVYNAGGVPNPPRELVLRLAEHFRFRRGPVFREVVVRPDQLFTAVGPPSTAGQSGPVGAGERFLRVSPLRILMQRALRVLEDGRILPNPDAERVAERTLAGGAPWLFMHGETQVEGAAAPERDPLTDWLTGQGFQVIVVLVPSKYQVYRPYLAGEGPGPTAHERLVELVERRFRAAGYTVVNPFPRLREAAPRHRAAGATLYWPDDSHLAPDGARLVAGEIEKVWKPLRIPRR